MRHEKARLLRRCAGAGVAAALAVGALALSRDPCLSGFGDYGGGAALLLPLSPEFDSFGGVYGRGHYDCADRWPY